MGGQASAAELKDGSWLFGLGGGAGLLLGSTRSKAAPAAILSGYAVYASREEGSWGLNADRFLFGVKKGFELDATALTLTRRAYFKQGNKEVLPYVLLALGWSESHADHPDGTEDRGAGAAGAIGGGFHRIKDGPISWGFEARLLRVGAGLRRTGVSGMTVFALTTSLCWRAGAGEDFFGR